MPGQQRPWNGTFTARETRRLLVRLWGGLETRFMHSSPCYVALCARGDERRTPNEALSRPQAQLSCQTLAPAIGFPQTVTGVQKNRDFENFRDDG